MNQWKDLSEDESRLLRLFRCMNTEEQDDLLISAGRALMRRYSVNPEIQSYHDSDSEYAREMTTDAKDDLEARLMMAFLCTDGEALYWDGLNDVGMFVAECIFDCLFHVFASSVHDDAYVSGLADSYLRFGPEWSPFSDRHGDLTDDELLAMLRPDFGTWLREWRERVISTIERQALLDHAPDTQEPSETVPPVTVLTTYRLEVAKKDLVKALRDITRFKKRPGKGQMMILSFAKGTLTFSMQYVSIGIPAQGVWPCDVLAPAGYIYAIAKVPPPEDPIHITLQGDLLRIGPSVIRAEWVSTSP